MKFRVRTADSIRWPNKCVTCGGTAATSYPAYGSSLARYKFKLVSQEISYYKKGISYPICHTHKNIVMVVRLLYFILFIAMIVFGIICFVFLASSVEHFSIFGLREGLIFCSIFPISIVAFITFMNLQPGRLKDIGKHFITIVIRSEQYAQEFALLNSLDPI